MTRQSYHHGFTQWKGWETSACRRSSALAALKYLGNVSAWSIVQEDRRRVTRLQEVFLGKLGGGGYLVHKVQAQLHKDCSAHKIEGTAPQEYVVLQHALRCSFDSTLNCHGAGVSLTCEACCRKGTGRGSLPVEQCQQAHQGRGRGAAGPHDWSPNLGSGRRWLSPYARPPPHRCLCGSGSSLPGLLYRQMDSSAS